MNNKLILIRSLPGAGKTYLANKLLVKYREEGYTAARRFSTDDWFSTTGKYNFDASKLVIAHKYTQSMVRVRVDRDTRLRNMTNGKLAFLAIVDNTFTQAWECKPYYDIAKDYGWEFVLKEPNTPWAFDVDELARKNVHGVPRETIQKMLNRWQTSEQIMMVLPNM